MKVILLDNIRGVGHIGDLKDVSDGYGRNFLIPRSLAKMATPGMEKEIAALQKKKAILLEQDRQRSQEAADKLKDLVLELKERANENGTLFAAVGKEELIKKIEEASGVRLTNEMVKLEEQIKSVGEHTVNVELSKEISAQVKINVVQE
jgi:large subunit ribosomal protein L9